MTLVPRALPVRVRAMIDHAPRCALVLALALAGACGTPADPPDGGGAFARASMAGDGGQESLVSARSIELVSWLVQFNRLNSADKLETMLNKKPGQFFPVDADADGSPDYIGVDEESKAKRGAHALVLSARPKKDGDGPKVATLFFDGDWGFLGYERVGAGNPPSATTIAAAAGAAASYAAAPPPPLPAKADGGPVTLTIQASGAVSLGGEGLGDAELRERMKALSRDQPGVKILIDADPAAPMTVVNAKIDVILDAGITKVAINDRAGAGTTALAQAGDAAAVRAVGAGSDEAAGVQPATP